jgi:hypothetical protein
MATTIDKFIGGTTQLAHQAGIRVLAITFHDPTTSTVKLVATPNAAGVLKAKMADWIGVPAGEAPGDADQTAEIARLTAENARLRNELASVGGDTGWEA